MTWTSSLPSSAVWRAACSVVWCSLFETGWNVVNVARCWSAPQLDPSKVKVKSYNSLLDFCDTELLLSGLGGVFRFTFSSLMLLSAGLLRNISSLSTFVFSSSSSFSMLFSWVSAIQVWACCFAIWAWQKSICSHSPSTTVSVKLAAAYPRT